MTRNERRKQLRYMRKAQAIELLGGKCVNCGSTERLEFDHINNDREDHKHMISWMLEGEWEKLVKELEKCQLLCVSCHRSKTSDDIRPIDFDYVEDYPVQADGHGTLSMYCNKKCRCEYCRAANAIYHRRIMRRNLEEYRIRHSAYAQQYRLRNKLKGVTI